ncbi:hypothetical protein [Haloferula sargassicola]|uniref:Uncharacterized protein n=1 Tax=Haloferula sargassicola TaxID=490096 RepID=A0ABP9UKU7_9BACT
MSDDAGKWVVPVFPEDEILHILAALLRCLKGLQKTSSLELETSLTKRLLKLLRQDSGLRDRPVWPFRETVIDDEESDAEGRLDLHFHLQDPRHKPPPYFAVEAKRLHVTFNAGWKSLVSDYVTHHQGMMCFIDGRYSKGLRSGGMVGYVFDGNIQRAILAISESLEAHREKLRSVTPHLPQPSSEFPLDTVWTTIHRVDGHSFTMFHILAEV